MMLVQKVGDTIKKHCIFLLANIVRKYPIWTGIKKTIPSFWINQFQLVCYKWGGFLAWQNMDHLIGILTGQIFALIKKICGR
jgi:hypothetical protein